MKFFGFVCAATALVGLAAADNTVTVNNEMQSGALCAGGNTEAGLGSKQVYLNYPGVGQKENDKTYFIRVTNDKTDENDKYSHDFSLSDENIIKNGGMFLLGLEDAKPGNYHMQSCYKTTDSTDETCSPKSTPAKPLDMGDKAKMDCARHDPLVNQITLKEIDGLAVADKVKQWGKVSGTYAYFYNFTEPKVYKKLGMQQTYSLYTAFEYDLTQFKQFYATSNQYCRRKYHLTVLLHLVDKTTKEVKHRFKFSPRQLSEPAVQKYVLKDQADKVPLEVLIKTDRTEKITGKYKFWSTVCVVEKDFGFGATEKSVACAAPYVADWDFSS